MGKTNTFPLWNNLEPSRSLQKQLSNWKVPFFVCQIVGEEMKNLLTHARMFLLSIISFHQSTAVELSGRNSNKKRRLLERSLPATFFFNTISRNETQETRYGFASICNRIPICTVHSFYMVERQPFYYFEAEKDCWDHFVTDLTYADQVRTAF